MVLYDDLGKLSSLFRRTVPLFPMRLFLGLLKHILWRTNSKNGMAQMELTGLLSPFTRPTLLNLGTGVTGVGVAGLECGFFSGLADDWSILDR